MYSRDVAAGYQEQDFDSEVQEHRLAIRQQVELLVLRLALFASLGLIAAICLK